MFGSVSAERAEGEIVATDLAQCCKTRSGGVGDLGPHGDVDVDLDTKMPGCSDWRHKGITDTNRTNRDLVLTS